MTSPFKRKRWVSEKKWNVVYVKWTNRWIIETLYVDGFCLCQATIIFSLRRSSQRILKRNFTSKIGFISLGWMSKKFYCRGRKVEKCKFIFEKSISTQQPGCLPVSDPLGSQTSWPLWLCRNAPDQKPANINLSHPPQMLRLKVQWLDICKSLSIRWTNSEILLSFLKYLSTEEKPFPAIFVDDRSCKIWGSDFPGQQISHRDVLASP